MAERGRGVGEVERDRIGSGDRRVIIDDLHTLRANTSDIAGVLADDRIARSFDCTDQPMRPFVDDNRD